MGSSVFANVVERRFHDRRCRRTTKLKRRVIDEQYGTRHDCVKSKSKTMATVDERSDCCPGEVSYRTELL